MYQNTTNLDYSPLTAPPSREVTTPNTAFASGALRQVWAFIAIGGVCLLLGIVGVVATQNAALGIIGGVAGAILLIYGLINLFKVKARIGRNVAFQAFATANNFSFTPAWSSVDEPGSIFRLGIGRATEATVQGVYNALPFWFGTHRYSIAQGQYRQTIVIGAVAVQLPRRLPHVVFDRKGNRTHISDGIARSQALQLEGDFNRYFSVYCPKEYAQDVLYFLTPELMEALIAMDDSLDAEIVGDRLYFYRRGPIEPNQAMVAKLFSLIADIGGAVAKNTAQYKDERSDYPGTIAAGGAALKTSLVPFIVGIVAVAALIILYFLR
ncbi:MAG TPA: hypothetical protein VD907_04275 [Verrucomicrobiae bacterium]|nr:hypothetical protein [Verrucomicrobiae bacterium]